LAYRARLDRADPERMPDKLEFRLVHYPEPILRKVAQPVARFDEELARTVEGMFDLMRRSNGVGLAAPQVGLDQRVLVLNPTGDEKDALALVNVVILERSGPETSFEEGCLSFPEIYAEVRRPERCKISAFAPDGTVIEREFDGFTSRIIQHEYDHLEGVLLVDRMTPAEKLKHKSALEELVTRYKRARPAEVAAQAAEREGARKE
jgi:peptide deformylase